MSAAASASLDRRRLARILAMLGSSYDGEVAAAGRRASTIIRAAGLSWEAVLEPPALPPVSTLPTPPLDADTIIAAAMTRPEPLTAWEFAFAGSLAERRPRRLSERRIDVLARIGAKVGVTR